MMPGAELDAAVCRAIGWDGCRAITNDGVELEYPAVSTDGNAMLRLIDAMRERGFPLEVEILVGVPNVHAQFHMFLGAAGDTLPHAVALAALAALSGERRTE